MSQLSIVEKLQLNEERNLLIQGLPSSIEKQFAKLSFAKNVTPLLKKQENWLGFGIRGKWKPIEQHFERSVTRFARWK